MPHAGTIPLKDTAEVIDADGSGTLAQVFLALLSPLWSWLLFERGAPAQARLAAEVHST